MPHIPDFLSNFVVSPHFTRLSLKKGARALLSGAAYRKFGASRWFFARCGAPRILTPYCLTAIADISIFAPPINPATWTVARAGLGSGISAL